ncbi:NAD(P)-dependent oxidoreductase [Limnohabitans sp.]|uniref:NAD(P)-dependent oxidoreductase n=1 Tax=Limnohabitans sp. TaxID=1907725 RepID=UPI0039BC52B1|nr:NAD(P)-dependent oxidoreductase [Comamonadaceae bacterium]
MAAVEKTKAALPRLGLVGLGIMGGTMAEALLQQGYEVCGSDIDPKALARLKRAGGLCQSSASEVVSRSDVVIISLSTSQALAQVTESIASVPKAQRRHKPIVIETSTLPMADKDACSGALGKLGITTLDAPISGTAVRIKERAWTFFVSGQETAFRKVLPVLQVFTDKVSFVGPYGNGTKMKFAANHLVAIYNVAYAESVTLARKMGLDPQDVLELFGNSPVLGTGVMRLRMPMMLERQYSPPTMKVEVWQKDMQVIGDMAKSVDCPTPLFSTCAAIYTSAMALGLAMEDTASTAEVMSAMAGIAPARARRKKPVKT